MNLSRDSLRSALKFRFPIALLILQTALVGFAQAPADWIAWQAKRKEAVAGTNGWTTVIGLHWLREGSNFLGRDASNRVVLRAEKAPAFVGDFKRQGKRAWFTAAEGVAVLADGKRIAQLELKTDLIGKPTKLELGLISMIVIDRSDDRLGLRVRDQEAPARREFKGLNYYPYNPAWRLEGRFVPFFEPRKMRMPEVTGGTQEYVSPGAIEFAVNGAKHRLEVAVEPDEEDYFIMFRDQTAGETTYNSGRFLYVAREDANGRVTIDFNRAYTPPCGFTAYATCPIPPRQNWLPFSVEAGELKPAGSHR